MMKKHLLLSTIIGLSLLGSMPHSPVQAAASASNSAPEITATPLLASVAPSANPYTGLVTTNEVVVYTSQTNAATLELDNRTKVL